MSNYIILFYLSFKNSIIQILHYALRMVNNHQLPRDEHILLSHYLCPVRIHKKNKKKQALFG